MAKEPNMIPADQVGGSAEVQIPIKDSFGPRIKLQSSFFLSCEENSPEGREEKRKEGWREVQEDLQQQLEETLRSFQEQLK